MLLILIFIDYLDQACQTYPAHRNEWVVQGWSVGCTTSKDQLHIPACVLEQQEWHYMQPSPALDAARLHCLALEPMPRAAWPQACTQPLWVCVACSSCSATSRVEVEQALTAWVVRVCRLPMDHSEIHGQHRGPDDMVLCTVSFTSLI